MTKIIQINQLFENILLELINSYNKEYKIGRPKKCSNKQYLTYIFYVAKTGCGWEYINGIVSGDAVRKKFNDWTNKNIFKDTWSIILHIYQTFKLDFDDLFIDASHIKNVLGTESIGSNHYDRYRNGTKLSIITDDEGIPISIKLDKSSVHDIDMLIPTLDNVDVSTTCNLIGDKGYISDPIQKELYKNKCINLITQKKKNMKTKNTKNELAKLKKRVIIEHTFAWIKSYKRIRNRYDKKLQIFESFIYFVASNLTSTRIEKIINN